jgi:hypothetical protein
MKMPLVIISSVIITWFSTSYYYRWMTPHLELGGGNGITNKVEYIKGKNRCLVEYNFNQELGFNIWQININGQWEPFYQN